MEVLAVEDARQRVTRWMEEASSVLRMMTRIHDEREQAQAAVEAAHGESARLRQELAAVRVENDLLRKERSEIADLIVEGIGKVTRVLERCRTPVAGPAVAFGAPPPHEEKGKPSSRRILVVDDNANFRNMITEYLAGNRGYDVVVAASGEEALRILPDFRPQVVLLDLRMPGIGGMGTLQQIKALRPGLSVVMITGDEDLGIARQALALGAADYVTKPFDLDYLDAVLNIYMARSDAPHGAALLAAGSAHDGAAIAPSARSVESAAGRR